MEFSVFGPARRLGWVLAAAMLLALLAAMTPLLMVARHAALRPAEVALLAWPAVVVLLLIVFVQAKMGARMRIDGGAGTIQRLHPLLGWIVARRSFRSSDFDRVSLGRGHRGGYRVDLVGREKDLLVSLTRTLAEARDRAREVAAALRLEVVDRL